MQSQNLTWRHQCLGIELNFSGLIIIQPFERSRVLAPNCDKIFIQTSIMLVISHRKRLTLYEKVRKNIYDVCVPSESFGHLFDLIPVV